MILPVSAVIPTKDRVQVLSRTLESLLGQSDLPGELVIIDASESNHEALFRPRLESAGIKLIYAKAKNKGAATQRMEGIAVSTEPFVLFMDDDILFEADCLRRIWKGFTVDERVGAINAMITNQQYTPPGRLTRIMYKLMSGETQSTFAGRVIGPAWNLLPEDRSDLPEYVRCDWLNTTCTMYKRSALPDPVFLPFFKGYAMMEDVSLSLMIAENHILLNARTARIFHDSQPGAHKDSVVDMSAMELTNRRFVMTNVMGRRSMRDYLKLAVFETFSLLSAFRTTQTIRLFPAILLGKIKAIVAPRR